MANVVEQARLVDKDNLPEELSGFESLGLNERNELVGLDEEGSPKVLRGVGKIAFELAKRPQVAEPVELEELPAAAQEIIRQLEARNRLLEDEANDLKNKNQELEARVNANDQKVQNLEAVVAELKEALEDRVRTVGGFTIGDEVALLVENDGDEEEYELGYQVVRFEKDDDEYKVVIANTETDEEQAVEPNLLVHEEELDVEDDDDAIESPFSPRDKVGVRRPDGKYWVGYEVIEVSDTDRSGSRVIKLRNPQGVTEEYDESRLKPEAEIADDKIALATQPPDSRTSDSRVARGWHRVSGGIGNRLLGYQAQAHNGVYNLVDRRGRIVREEVETVDGYPVESERAGAAAVVGGLALLGVGILVGWLATRHGNHDIVHTVTETVPGKNGGTGHINEHLETWNSTTNSGSGIAVGLPKGYHLVQNAGNGYHEIIDNHGNVVAGHITMTKTGAISQHSLNYLQSKGLVKVGQTHIRYWDNTGPTLNPKLPSAKNPGWNTHTVTLLGRA